MGLTTNYADDPILVGRFDSLAPAYSACGLPVCVAGVPAAPLCQTPAWVGVSQKRPTRSSQRLIEILDQIVSVFQANGQAQQTFR
jgi:hypothetical protein